MGIIRDSDQYQQELQAFEEERLSKVFIGHILNAETWGDLQQLLNDEDAAQFLEQPLTQMGVSISYGSKGRKGKRTRTRLTDEQKEAVKQALKAGGTAKEVAEQFGVSTATVNNIKSDAGLTKKTPSKKSKKKTS